MVARPLLWIRATWRLSRRRSDDLVQERDRPFEGLHPVLELADHAAFVGVHDQLAADSLLREDAVDLLRLLQRHAGVVGSVLDEERDADPVDVRDRGGLDEEIAVALERPVLPLAHRAPPRRR